MIANGQNDRRRRGKGGRTMASRASAQTVATRRTVRRSSSGSCRAAEACTSLTAEMFHPDCRRRSGESFGFAGSFPGHVPTWATAPTEATIKTSHPAICEDATGRAGEWQCSSRKLCSSTKLSRAVACFSRRYATDQRTAELQCSRPASRAAVDRVLCTQRGLT